MRHTARDCGARRFLSWAVLVALSLLLALVLGTTLGSVAALSAAAPLSIAALSPSAPTAWLLTKAYFGVVLLIVLAPGLLR